MLRNPTDSTPTMSEKVRASHILCKHTASRNPVSRRTNQAVLIDKTAAMKEIQDIISRVCKDPGLFAKLAHERSDCGSYSRGGDLGFFGRGEMQKAFEQATYALKVGEMSGPVETDSGIHVILRTA
jgi:NIMA-interacting peptidyl-prolyl cis-trans isomerase 1